MNIWVISSERCGIFRDYEYAFVILNSRIRVEKKTKIKLNRAEVVPNKWLASFVLVPFFALLLLLLLLLFSFVVVVIDLFTLENPHNESSKSKVIKHTCYSSIIIHFTEITIASQKNEIKIKIINDEKDKIINTQKLWRLKWYHHYGYDKASDIHIESLTLAKR